MSDKNPDKELSLDELKDVSGGIRMQGGGYKSTTDKKKSKGTSLDGMETGTVNFEDRIADDFDIHEPTPRDAISG